MSLSVHCLRFVSKPYVLFTPALLLMAFVTFQPVAFWSMDTFHNYLEKTGDCYDEMTGSRVSTYFDFNSNAIKFVI